MRDLPVRKQNRLKGYDYSKSGTYFITICTQNRHPIWGQISVGDGVPDVPQMKPTEYGIILKKYIKSVNQRCKNIEINKYVIMPNHLHMIVFVNSVYDGTSRTPSPTNKIIPSIVSTLKRFVNKECGFSMFQRSYHDHIIRNKQEYERICKYIDTNIIMWKEDCFHVIIGDKNY